MVRQAHQFHEKWRHCCSQCRKFTPGPWQKKLILSECNLWLAGCAHDLQCLHAVLLCNRWTMQVHPNPDVPSEKSEEHVSSELPLDVLNNYFSLGSDAMVAVEFHESRGRLPLLLQIQRPLQENLLRMDPCFKPSPSSLTHAAWPLHF